MTTTLPLSGSKAEKLMTRIAQRREALHYSRMERILKKTIRKMKRTFLKQAREAYNGPTANRKDVIRKYQMDFFYKLLLSPQRFERIMVVSHMDDLKYTDKQLRDHRCTR